MQSAGSCARHAICCPSFFNGTFELGVGRVVNPGNLRKQAVLAFERVVAFGKMGTDFLRIARKAERQCMGVVEKW